MIDRIRSGALWALALSFSFAILSLCWAAPAAPTNLQIQHSPTPTALFSPFGPRYVLHA